MARLTDAEKHELVSMMADARMQEDFRAIRRNRDACNAKNGSVALDDYLRFLTLSNAFINHAFKPFSKMKGNNFKL
jgi:hypothetical protein